MALKPKPIDTYYVFLASPGDVSKERQQVRDFFDEYNRTTARHAQHRFEVVDWENYATIGVGRPQDLITQQTLERHQKSLALVVGIMDQRYGTPTGASNSGTEEELDWALESFWKTGFPEIKWFFRKRERTDFPTEPEAIQEALDQWQKVLAFRRRLEKGEKPIFFAEYPSPDQFIEVLRKDLSSWLADPRRPWNSVPPAPTLPNPREDFWRIYAENFEQRVKVAQELDERFVQLTLLLDNGVMASERWQRKELRTISEIIHLNETKHRVMVILGAPGSGKSTILRRLELDFQRQQRSNQKNGVSFFVPLNRYKPGSPDQPLKPLEFLESMWGRAYGGCGLTLDELLYEGQVLLLLDAINEVQHSSKEDYEQLIDLWREFAIDQNRVGNRIIFTCRTLDYSKSLSSGEMPVPNVELQPLPAEKIGEFLRSYLPEKHEEVLETIQKQGTLDFYNTPYFLSLLCKQIGYTGEVPKGRASLFTGYVREAVKREMDSDLFKRERLLSDLDRRKLNLNRWADTFQLPEESPLMERLTHLAYEMQQSGHRKENKQISIGFNQAVGLIGTDKPETIIKAGVAVNVLDWDLGTNELTYFHQLLQEYFAGRRMACEPKPELVRVEWRASEVRPSLAETIAGLAIGDPLPPLGQTGWEETTLAALPMSGDPEGYVAQLMEQNLPLAARCAVSPEVEVSEELKDRIREGLIARTQEMTADLRARIAAGEALGLIGDPRFERQTGRYGDYLAPPLVEIPAGSYPIGDDRSGYDDEGPAHDVELRAYRIGAFPVTNAEYRCFIEAGGYEDERWWETEAARYWRREGGAEGQRQVVRYLRERLNKFWTNESLDARLEQGRDTPDDAEYYRKVRNLPVDKFEKWLLDEHPPGKVYRQPEFWNDQQFNNPQQPVVGVTWFEARAYCSWLTATSGLGGEVYRLPTEVEFEAAARGREGRAFPYGDEFDSACCNTFESHIRRTTPVGIFANATPEGAYDLSGNAYTWTSTIYDGFSYPWRDDGREDPEDAESRRLVRGGSWNYDLDNARAAYRSLSHPASRYNFSGFRVVCGVRPPSPGH